MVHHALQRLKRLAAEARPGAARLVDQPLMRCRIGELELRAFALEEAAYQAVEAMMDGSENGAEASLIKLRGTELYQDIAEATVEALGLAGVAWDAAALNG